MKILPETNLANVSNGNSERDAEIVSNHSSENNSQLSPRNVGNNEGSQLTVLNPEQQSSALAVTNSSDSQIEPTQWSPAMQSLLEEPPSNLPLQLIVGGVVFCLTFLAWAWFGQIDQIGKAQGKLIPKGEAYKI
ncbi:MAG: hypothetical protein RLZZ381_2541, partial [Cyanobacteriota bacterium]